MAIEHSEGMRKWHASRTPEQKAATSLKLSDAAACRLWVRHGRGNRNGRPGARKTMDQIIGTTTLLKIERASIKRIMKEIAGTEPELVREAIREGLMAPPPRSFPYVALLAAYLDGKPVDAGTHQEMNTRRSTDLSELSREQLRQRALLLAERFADEMDKRQAAVIDAEVVPEREPTLEELQIEIQKAEEEKRRADAEVAVYHRIQRVVTMNEEQK